MKGNEMGRQSKSGMAFVRVLIVLALPGVSLADVTSMPEEVRAIKRDMERMKAELADTRMLLGELPQEFGSQPGVSRARSARSSIVKVEVGTGPSLGKSDAPVTIVEFSDYQCPYCSRFAATTLPELRRAYVDTGKVRYVYRDFPVDSIHPQARKASEAARCAEDQGKFWEMHDLLFAKPRLLQGDELKRHATTLQLDETTFDSCLDENKRAAAVTDDARAERAAGVVGTPTFFIGRTTRGGAIEATRLVGAPSIDNFRRAIEVLLAE